MSGSGSVRASRVERSVETVTANGKSSHPHAFVVLEVETGNGTLRVEVDAGDWSRMLAAPGTRQVCDLSVG